MTHVGPPLHSLTGVSPPTAVDATCKLSSPSHFRAPTRSCPSPTSLRLRCQTVRTSALDFPARPPRCSRSPAPDTGFRCTATLAFSLCASASHHLAAIPHPSLTRPRSITQWSLYLGLSVEATVDLIVAVAQCLLLKGFETGIRRCVPPRDSGPRHSDVEPTCVGHLPEPIW